MPPTWRRRDQSVAGTTPLTPPLPLPAALQVGHLLGLGDRHLDNMLLHSRGGHLVHIDFSIIFERWVAWCGWCWRQLV